MFVVQQGFYHTDSRCILEKRLQFVKSEDVYIYYFGMVFVTPLLHIDRKMKSVVYMNYVKIKEKEK